MAFVMTVVCSTCGKEVGSTRADKPATFDCGGCGGHVEYNPIFANDRYQWGVEGEPEQGVPEDGTRVLCPRCKKNLLGVWHNGVLQIRHKGKEWSVIGGSIGVHCHPECGGQIIVETRTYEVNIVPSLDDYIAEHLEGHDPDPLYTTAALKLALANNIDIGTLKGTGKEGRILTADVDKAIENR